MGQCLICEAGLERNGLWTEMVLCRNGFQKIVVL